MQTESSHKKLSQKEKDKIHSKMQIGFVLGYIARQMGKYHLTKEERDEIVYLTQVALYN